MSNLTRAVDSVGLFSSEGVRDTSSFVASRRKRRKSWHPALADEEVHHRVRTSLNEQSDRGPPLTLLGQERTQHIFVQYAVARHAVSRFDRGVAAEIRHATSSLFDNYDERCQIPWVDLRLDHHFS
jgi:hypothetical protein